MASQTLVLGEPNRSQNNLRYTWNVSLLIDPVLTEGGAASYLRRFRVFSDGNVEMSFSATPQEGAVVPGPDLTSLAETDGLLTMSVPAVAPVALNAPRNSGNRIESNFSDTDPYKWRVPVDQQAELEAFFTTLNNLFSFQRTTSLILFDGVVPPAEPADIARAQSFSLTGRRPIYALEISHPSITDNVLAVGDSEGVTLEGNAYPALGFQARLPQDKEGEVRQAGLEIDNVGRELVEWVEASEGGRGAVIRIMEIVVDSARDARIVWEMSLDVGTTRLSNEKLSVVLVDEGASMSQAIKLRHDPVESPGLF